MKSILLIGCGHMGGSLLESWIKTKKYSFNIIDPKMYSKINKKFNNKYVTSFKSIESIKNFKRYDFIIFAVKPIDLKLILKNFKLIKFKKNIVAISIVAGKKINIFEKNIFNINQIVRVMPNLPAIIGQSMNCMVSNKYVNKNNKNEIKKLFDITGMSIWLKNEDQIDKATAISGSGPGYVFKFIDSMEKAALNLGFNKNISKLLVLETFKGSINLILKNKKNAEDLLLSVATKGGTTEAGINIMNKNKINNILSNAIKSAYKKAKQHSKK